MAKKEQNNETLELQTNIEVVAMQEESIAAATEENPSSQTDAEMGTSASETSSDIETETEATIIPKKTAKRRRKLKNSPKQFKNRRLSRRKKQKGRVLP